MHSSGTTCILTLFSVLFFEFVWPSSALRIFDRRHVKQAINPVIPDINEATIEDLQLLQADGVLTSVDLVQVFINRIREANCLFHAVSEVNPDALSIARALDREREAGQARGPLHGIPVLVKDNIATLDRLNNTAGSLALLGATVNREAPVVTRLREAGAVILGKATTGEWAQMRSSFSGSSHGWSAYGGQPIGAYYPHQNPLGSSSGSAIATSLGLTFGALATETSGSILLPAEKGNIVGIKPTIGLTSRTMVIPISRRQDSVGPHARTVKDAAYLLSVIAGVDKDDEWTQAQPFDSAPDYAKACDSAAFDGARIGIPRNGFATLLDKSTSPVVSALDDALELMRKAGAKVFDDANLASFDLPALMRNMDTVLDTDFVEGVKDYFSLLVKNPNNLHNLHDVMQFTKESSLEKWPDHDIYAWERALDRNITSDSKESRAAYGANLAMAEEDGILGVLEKYRLDAVVMPTFASFYLPAVGGLPVVTVPLGFYPADTKVIWNDRKTLIDKAPGIPFGISFIGRKWSEEKLIGLAYAFEQRTQVRQQMRPLFQPSFDLRDQVSLRRPTKVDLMAIPSPEEVIGDQWARPSTVSTELAIMDHGLPEPLFGLSPKARDLK